MAPVQSPPTDAFLPLRPADFHILMVLLREDLHGYGIMQQVSVDSHGRVALDVGSLYRIIARLSDEGLITDARRPSRGADSRRRYYSITALGRKVAQREARRLADVVRLARSRKLLDGLVSG